MNEDLFFKIVISILIIGFFINFIQDYYSYKYIKAKLSEASKSINDLWSQIHRIDEEKKKTDDILEISKESNLKNINNIKADLIHAIDKIDKDVFEKEIIVNRLNNHAKKIAYVKKVLDKLFDHKVEIKHKAKLVKLEGELDKW